MRLVSARCGGRVLDPFPQQPGEGSRVLKRRQMPGVWPVDTPGTSDPGDNITIPGNHANGSPGKGGGIYNLGSFVVDLFTVIKDNFASTSNNDIFT